MPTTRKTPVGSRPKSGSMIMSLNKAHGIGATSFADKGSKSP